MKRTSYLTLFLLFAFAAVAQEEPVRWDTLKYQKFKTSLIVGVFQSYRSFNNDFQQFKVPDSLGRSKYNYFAESRQVTGIEVTYDKFSFAVGFKSAATKQNDGKGRTNTFNTNLNLGGNIWFFQNSFRYFKGFYDDNAGNYDSTRKQYYQRPDMQNILFRSKFLYFTNHKRYAFRSGYAGNYRQLRSAATWIFSANLNYYDLQSDSSFFPLASRAYYNDYASMHGLRVIGLSLNAGGAATLVLLKALFINGMFIVGPEQQWRKYSYENGSSSLSYVSISGDLRFSIGLNLKRCYIMATNTNDFVIYNSSFVGLTNKFISGGFAFGWRFHSVKMPAVYQKFQKTKFYTSI